jgi:hypothetical protein
MAVITRLAAAVGGSKASLKLSVTVRALATVAPSAGVEATTFVCASAAAGYVTAEAAIATAARREVNFIT